MKKIVIFSLLCILIAGCNVSKSSIKPTGLTTEYHKDAFVDVPSPRFSWINVSGQNGAAQSSYHIRVFKDPQNPEKTYWDSGIKISKESVLVPYKAKRWNPAWIITGRCRCVTNTASRLHGASRATFTPES